MRHDALIHKLDLLSTEIHEESPDDPTMLAVSTILDVCCGALAGEAANDLLFLAAVLMLAATRKLAEGMTQDELVILCAGVIPTLEDLAAVPTTSFSPSFREKLLEAMERLKDKLA